MFGTLALILTTIVVGRIVWSIDDWGRDFTTNHARLDADAQNPSLRPVLLTESPAAARSRVEDWVDTQRHWAVVSTRTEGSDVTMHLTRTTLLMRFVDDIHLVIQPLAGDGIASRITAESRSRIGSGDLGQNPRNLIELTSGIAGKP